MLELLLRRRKEKLMLSIIISFLKEKILRKNQGLQLRIWRMEFLLLLAR